MSYVVKILCRLVAVVVLVAGGLLWLWTGNWRWGVSGFGVWLIPAAVISVYKTEAKIGE